MDSSDREVVSVELFGGAGGGRTGSPPDGPSPSLKGGHPDVVVAFSLKSVTSPAPPFAPPPNPNVALILFRALPGLKRLVLEEEDPDSPGGGGLANDDIPGKARKGLGNESLRMSEGSTL